MKSYRDSTGTFHRTQAEAKASGHPFEPVEIPTAHADLIDFVNRLTRPDFEELEPVDRRERLTEGRAQFASRTDYQNGDHTVVVMKSRDPMARFTCKACGVVNAPVGDR